MMENLVISQNIQKKLNEKHGVSVNQVYQCFENREEGLLEDEREEHRTDPPTKWFISRTNHGKLLKIVFVAREGKIFLKTAYPPNDDEISIYKTAYPPKDNEINIYVLCLKTMK